MATIQSDVYTPERPAYNVELDAAQVQQNEVETLTAIRDAMEAMIDTLAETTASYTAIRNAAADLLVVVDIRDDGPRVLDPGRAAYALGRLEALTGGGRKWGGSDD